MFKSTPDVKIEVFKMGGRGAIVRSVQFVDRMIVTIPYGTFVVNDRSSFRAALLDLLNSPAQIAADLGQGVMAEVAAHFGLAAPSQMVGNAAGCMLVHEAGRPRLVPFVPVIHDRGRCYEFDYDQEMVFEGNDINFDMLFDAIQTLNG